MQEQRVENSQTAHHTRIKAKAAADGHRGIIWIHFSGLAVWLLTAGLLGALMLAGKSIPSLVVIGGLAAAAGHGLFIITHLLLANAARRRITAEAAGAATPRPAAQDRTRRKRRTS
jgi:hypothetical protein